MKLNNLPIIGKLAANLKQQLFPKVKFENSSQYWEERYAKEGNSGDGSYNNLAEHKAEVINEFVKSNDIKTVIEFGSGDGNQLKMFDFENYIGFDVSDTILEKCREMYKADQTKKFLNVSDYSDQRAEFSMSLDVIYHLVEDSIYEAYMKQLTSSSSKYLLVFSSNKVVPGTRQHVKHRVFTDWIEKQGEFKQISYIPNKYPFDLNDPAHTSMADFYFFERI